MSLASEPFGSDTPEDDVLRRGMPSLSVSRSSSEGGGCCIVDAFDMAVSVVPERVNANGAACCCCCFGGGGASGGARASASDGLGDAPVARDWSTPAAPFSSAASAASATVNPSGGVGEGASRAAAIVGVGATVREPSGAKTPCCWPSNDGVAVPPVLPRGMGVLPPAALGASVACELAEVADAEPPSPSLAEPLVEHWPPAARPPPPSPRSWAGVGAPAGTAGELCRSHSFASMPPPSCSTKSSTLKSPSWCISSSRLDWEIDERPDTVFANGKPPPSPSAPLLLAPPSPSPLRRRAKAPLRRSRAFALEPEPLGTPPPRLAA
mmetsp:Transcript_19390/g.49568  ORF Transcript_19390/g.49568 Transcript_19390/m.49568 type:complete len:324 (-) Transcript_19390:451-1422(-)